MTVPCLMPALRPFPAGAGHIPERIPEHIPEHIHYARMCAAYPPMFTVHADGPRICMPHGNDTGFHDEHPQRGQAAAEALLVLLLLGALWVGTAWLLRWQDVALQAQHASRYAAFAATRDSAARPLEEIRGGHFSGPAHLWRDRRGASLLSAGLSEISLQVERGQALGPQAQPGGLHVDARDLRQGWGVGDTGMVTAHLAVDAFAGEQALPASGLAQFDVWRPGIRRHTAILAGAGHAASDAQAQQRVAGSGLGWADAADRSYALGRRVQSWAGGLDRPWGRAEPVFDWLGPWAGRVPGQHVSDTLGPQRIQDIGGASHAGD
ncbi:hypothetical protein KVP10_00140 [Candidimonas humi]|uniref:Uncharacterized protein n=1 Tax=Candidimonas humi TaxID=683355 RepID=A0ABV8NUI4_9BURK|nr:hypothetical protein [Candidimonas humi]MBV6303270.1 hypothetical protein [Candidimonas humi]